MTKLQHQVLAFHKAFDHPTADSPTIPPDARVRFRAAFIVEECLEFLEATLDTKDPRFSIYMTEIRNRLSGLIGNAPIKVDLPLAVDALADIDYVVEGTRLEFGVNGEPIADEVHRSNMAKAHPCHCPEIRPECPKCHGTGRIVVKRADGKTLKPPGWTPPDIAGEIDKQRAGKASMETVIKEDSTTFWHDARYEQLKKHALELPPMTALQKDQQALDFTHGNLAIDGKANRAAFKALATGPRAIEPRGFGWTEAQFDAWANGREWNDDGK